MGYQQGVATITGQGGRSIQANIRYREALSPQKRVPVSWSGSIESPELPNKGTGADFYELETGEEYHIKLADGRSGWVRIEHTVPRQRKGSPKAIFVGQGPLQ